VREAEARAGAETGREEAAALVRGPRDEHERSSRADARERIEHPLLVLLPQRIGVAYDEDLRASEEGRRIEIGERGRDLLGVLVAPEDAPRPRAPGREEPPPEQGERPIEQVGLLAEQQIVRSERRPLEGGERVRGGAGAPPAVPARGAQKPSIAWR
jgi:hypothetical protein